MVYLFEPEALSCIPSGRACDIAREFFPLLAERRAPFYGTMLPFTWIDIGRTADYWRATQMVLRGELNFMAMPGTKLREGVRCIVGEYTRISGLADVHEKIISGRFCVDRDGNNVDLARTGYAFVIDDIRERRQWTEDQRALIEFLKAQALC